MFGEEGYVRASTRQIAQAAGVTPPALQYYFEGKDGLHSACAEAIIDRTLEQLAPAMERAEHPSSAQEAARCLCDLLETLLDISASRVEASAWARFSARVQAEQAGPAYPLFIRRLIVPLQNLSARLAAKAMGRDAGDETAMLNAALLLNQMSAFHVNRATSLELLGWPDLAGERLDRVKALVRRNVLAMLSA